MAELALFATVSLKNKDFTERVIKTCLLVYDDENFSDEALSNDLREQLESHPSTDRIYVAAPRVKNEEILEQVRIGTSLIRTSQHENRTDPLLRFVVAEKDATGAMELVDCHYERPIKEEGLVLKKIRIDNQIQQAWLFDLFVQQKGMVLAPTGVHFGKTSGKHSDRFLRTANVLLTSAICRLIAFFCLPLIPKRPLRQIYVDTAPLLSVGLAVIELCKIHGITIDSGRIRSFSSYAGIDGGIEFKDSDLILISASTSGGLVKGLIQRGANPDATLTLFYLQAKGWAPTQGLTLSNLTHQEGLHFGFSEVRSFTHDNCPLCREGVLLAEFEGDQFLLQRRKTKRLKVTKWSQHSGAKAFLELATRHEAISVLMNGSGRSRKSDIHFDLEKLSSLAPEIRNALSFKIRRGVPAPLDLVVSDDTTVAQISALSTVGDRVGINPALAQHTSNNLEAVTPVGEAGVFVYFSTLNDDLVARSINRSLRSIAPRGSISYVAALLIIDSPEAKRDLLSFLKYGERGPNTFQFDSVYDLLIFQRDERFPWELERELLMRISQRNDLPAQLVERLALLNSTAQSHNRIFLPGQAGELKIANDFVYLDTSKNKEKISQGDVYLVVANLLASCRNDDREIEKPLPRGSETQIWENSIYGQVLLCPKNFKDYNDGVLHAAILRVAKRSELRYDTDPALSEEMLEVLLSEVKAWQFDSGQALAEFAMAIATGRLRLASRHLEEFERVLNLTDAVPDWIKLIFSSRGLLEQA